MALLDIDTFVILILENRSFDHMLGYLSLAPGGMPVDGLRQDPAWQARYVNSAAGTNYPLHPLSASVQKIDDPPHDHTSIASQISTPPADPEVGGMGGFVASYLTRQPAPADASAVMGYYGADAVPMFDFLARHFTVCDQWFAALPTGTQANRLMLMSGDTDIVDNAKVFLPDQPLVYDWLTEHSIPWRAYQSGDFLPFFSLMPDRLTGIARSLAVPGSLSDGNFRRYDRFREEWNATDPMPNVIFIEPEYTDGPHLQPNDDHSPTGVDPGQQFLAQVYKDLVSNSTRWAKTALIVTYDEHGGFFDHVPPLPIPYQNGPVQFATTGVRVPAFVVSPQVPEGSVFSKPLDHTCMLQLLADRFTNGADYSSSVALRQAKLGRIAELFVTPFDPTLEPRAPLPAVNSLAPATMIQAQLAQPIRDGISEGEGESANATAFQNAASTLARAHPELLNSPGWEQLARYVKQTQNGLTCGTAP